MAISGINSSNYTSCYALNVKNEVKPKNEKVEETSSKNAEKMDHKNTVLSNKKVGGMNSKSRNVSEYTEYVQKKFAFFNKSTLMAGIPTTVSVSSAFIKKCANNPEKAKYLEENLSVLPELAAKTHTSCLGTVTSQSWTIDANGNISATVSGTSDPDGKIAKENAEKRAKESQEKEKKLKEKREAKKAAEKKIVEKKANEEAVNLEDSKSVIVSENRIKTSEKIAYNSSTINVGSNFNSFG